ncbi:unnamed protein product [Symbiodinium sp. CCMP2592]|nr:unnamed protein product [Symbiodinium sp. CCMP2592]
MMRDMPDNRCQSWTPGNEVEVWSESLQSWLVGQVVEVRGNMIDVEFVSKVHGIFHKFRKRICLNSENLRLCMQTDADVEREQDPDAFSCSLSGRRALNSTGLDVECEQDPDFFVSFLPSWFGREKDQKCCSKILEFLGKPLKSKGVWVNDPTYMFSPGDTDSTNGGADQAFTQKYTELFLTQNKDGHELLYEKYTPPTVSVVAGLDSNIKKSVHAGAGGKLELTELKGPAASWESDLSAFADKASSAGSENLKWRVLVITHAARLGSANLANQFNVDMMSKKASSHLQQVLRDSHQKELRNQPDKAEESMNEWFASYGESYVVKVYLGGVLELTFKKISGPTKFRAHFDLNGQAADFNQAKAAGGVGVGQEEAGFETNVSFDHRGGGVSLPPTTWKAGTSVQDLTRSIKKWQESVAQQPAVVKADLCKYTEHQEFRDMKTKQWHDKTIFEEELQHQAGIVQEREKKIREIEKQRGLDQQRYEADLRNIQDQRDLDRQHYEEELLKIQDRRDRDRQQHEKEVGELQQKIEQQAKDWKERQQKYMASVAEAQKHLSNNTIANAVTYELPRALRDLSTQIANDLAEGPRRRSKMHAGSKSFTQ